MTTVLEYLNAFGWIAILGFGIRAGSWMTKIEMEIKAVQDDVEELKKRHG